MAPPIAQTLAVAGSFRSIAFDRAGEHAYVTGTNDNGDGVIYQFEVQSDGALTAMTPAFVDGYLPFVNSIDSEPLDRFVYAVDGGFSRLVQFSRTREASLVPLNPSWLSNATTFPWLVKAEPFGDQLYVAAPGSIASFIIDPSGTLSPGTPERVLVPAESFTAFALDLAGAYVYAAAGNFVHVYQTGANGALTHIDAATIATGPRPVAVAVSP